MSKNKYYIFNNMTSQLSKYLCHKTFSPSFLLCEKHVVCFMTFREQI